MGRATLPPFFSRPPGLLRPGGIALATVMSESAAGTQIKAGYQGKRGSLVLDWVAGGDSVELICISLEWTAGTKTNTIWRVRTWRLKITSLMWIMRCVSRLQGHFVFTAAKWLSRLDNKPVLCWLALSTLGVCLSKEENREPVRKMNDKETFLSIKTLQGTYKTLFKQQLFKIHVLLLCETCRICLINYSLV